jgi:hypothetical protein
MFNMIYGFVIARLRERSTWAAIVSTLAVRAGLHLTGDQTTDLTNIGLAMVAAVVAFVPEKPVDHKSTPFV